VVRPPAVEPATEDQQSTVEVKLARRGARVANHATPVSTHNEPQRGQLVAFLDGLAVSAYAGVEVGLTHPLPHGGLGQIETLRNLTYRSVTAPAHLHESPP